MEEINYSAVVILIESNWIEFVEYSGSESDAETTLATIRKKAGMEA